MRALTKKDVGNVFVRPRATDEPNKFYLLYSIGPPPPPIICSFITFTLAGGQIATVGSTGHANSPYYEPVTFIPSNIITEVRERWEAEMAEFREKLREIEARTPKIEPISIPPRATSEAGICPLCFILYPIAAVKSSHPTCPECESEAITVPLESLDSFLAHWSLDQLRKTLERWKEAKGFLDEYKNEKAKRIEAVIKISETMKRGV